jgi:hypothetical protein
VTHSPPNISDSPEWKLLLATSAEDPEKKNRIGELLRNNIDWETAVRLAERHGVLALMYQSLEGFAAEVPASVLAALREKYETNLHKTLLLTRELIRVLDSLDGLRMEALPYKGVVLSEVYYGDAALRQCGDIDLFVRAKDVTRVKSAMRELGYTERVSIPENAERDYIAAGYECPFDSPAGNNLLELQWELQPRYYAVDFDMEGLFERAVEVRFADRRVKTLSAEDLLLVLSIHGAKHVWGKLIWLCDVERVLKAKVNWERVRALASRLGVKRILHVTLALTEKLVGGAIPPEMVEAVRGDRIALEFADEIAKSIAAGVDYEQKKISYFRLMMRVRERRMDRVRFLTRLAFTPGPGEWEIVRLPRILFPFYRVVRLARLAGRLARG